MHIVHWLVLKDGNFIRFESSRIDEALVIQDFSHFMTCIYRCVSVRKTFKVASFGFCRVVFGKKKQTQKTKRNRAAFACTSVVFCSENQEPGEGNSE